MIKPHWGNYSTQSVSQHKYSKMRSDNIPWYPTMNGLSQYFYKYKRDDMLVSLLGLSTMGNGTSSPCIANCSSTSGCSNCSDSNISYGAAFASFSYLLLLISSIQLVLVIIYDAVEDNKSAGSPWWARAFRVTVQKCLLGAVIMATGTRAIYYTVLSYIPSKWADILLNVYYPSLLSAFSLLICFWAEYFYHSSPVDGRHFLRKYKYSVTFLVFNIVVYLLLIANIVATPLISDQEQLKMTGIVNIIFAFLFLVTLVGFLHFAIRLFFRPDWQLPSFRLEVLKVNLRQQAASICGIVTNALMQSLIIALLLFNMVGQLKHVDRNSLYVCAIVIRVTELVLPVWFCCSLWNYKQPKTLWILNPSLVLKVNRNDDDAESSPILREDSSGDYGTFQKDSLEASDSSQDEGCCWVCQGVINNPEDLFYPCHCRLHRSCIKQWVAKRASNSNIPEKEYLQCQVCRKKYRVRRFACLCIPLGLQRKHWLQLFVVLFILGASVAGCVYAGKHSSLNTTAKIATIACVVVFNAILLKLLGCGMVLAWRKSKYTTIEIKGISVEKWRKIMKKKTQQTINGSDVIKEGNVTEGRTNLTSSVHYTSISGIVTIECDNGPTPS